MASMNNLGKLSIIVPTLNESKRLPLLLADILRYPYEFEIIIIDGGSSDNTDFLASLSGAKVIKLNEGNRGKQLQVGGFSAIGDWLLFLHADSRLNADWSSKVFKVIINSSNKKYAWFFTLNTNRKGLGWSIFKAAVAIRSNLFQRPYGDQGLLIDKDLYFKIGGYRPLNLMEDLDLVMRLSKKTTLKCIGTDIITSTRKYAQSNIILNAINNARLRKKWIKGTSSKDLAKSYYLIQENN